MILPSCSCGSCGDLEVTLAAYSAELRVARQNGLYFAGIRVAGRSSGYLSINRDMEIAVEGALALVAIHHPYEAVA